MDEKEAIKYLKNMNDESCDLIIDLIKRMRDELDSTWQMLDELKQSEVLNHQKELTQKINDLLREKSKIISKIAKVSEA